MTVRDDHHVTPDRDESVADFNARLAAAESRLSDRKGGADGAHGGQDGSAEDFSALGLALRLGTELVAGLAVGVAIGWGLDRWLGYRALFLILFSLLGGFAGVLNVWHVVGRTMVDSASSGSRRGGA